MIGRAGTVIAVVAIACLWPLTVVARVLKPMGVLYRRENWTPR